MRRSMILLALLSCVPAAASAISLKWSTGNSNLTFLSARVCTLLVRTGASEPLPAEWRLVWIASGDAQQALAVLPQSASVADTAHVRALTLPQWPVERIANDESATLRCTTDQPHVAQYVLNVAAGTHGKLRVLAFKPLNADSSSFRILQSSDATLNGGVSSAYPPAVLHASMVRSGDGLYLSAAGTGLSAVTQGALVGADTSWHQALALSNQTDTTITGSATVYATLPASVFVASGTTGTGIAPIPAESVSPPPLDPLVKTYYFYPPVPYRPKDFAFVYGQNAFHLFYINHDTTSSVTEAANEKTFQHVTSTDLSTWSSPVTAFHVSATGWDAGHVWAPSIIQRGNTYYLYYTGVDGSGNQRTGVATSTNLNDTTWTRWSSNPIFSATSTSWINRDPQHLPYLHQQQLRDPFVMEDPHDRSRWLMYYVALTDTSDQAMAVGVARSDSASATAWTDIGPIATTLGNVNSTSDWLIESPHVVYRQETGSYPSMWWLMYTAPTHESTGKMLTFAFNPTYPDTTAAYWSVFPGVRRLYTWLKNDATVFTWRASEYLHIGNEYLAGYTSNSIGINQIGWTPHNLTLNPMDSLYFASATTVGVEDEGRHEAELALAVTQLRPAMGRISLRVTVPTAMAAQLDVYDISGRRIRELLRQALPAGPRTVVWDCRDRDGHMTGTGMYFARLSTPRGCRVVRLPLIR